MENNKRTFYPFVDLVRFVSMAGIVWAHVNAFPVDADPFEFLKRVGDVELYIAFKQLPKFSVVCFFMISGFLLGDNLTHVSPFKYFKRRVDGTLGPFVFAFTLFLVIIFCRDFVFYNTPIDPLSLPRRIYYSLFFTPYWFLPTYYIGLITIIILYRFADSLKCGLFLLMVNMFYTIPYFAPLIGSQDHTTSIFAFVFYLWLGSYIRKNLLIPKIKDMSFWWLVPAILLSYILACGQSILMFEAGNHFYFNNLRIFNQIYGLLFFFFLVKLCPATPVKFWMLNPRKETFGIYLYHFYVVAFVYPSALGLLEKNFHFNLYDQPMIMIVVYSFVYYVITYILTVTFVRLCLRLKLKIV